MKYRNSEDLAQKLAQDYPDFIFQSSKTARWSSGEKTIFYDDNIDNLLHELGHAINNHNDFTQDIELIKLERDAWETARKVALHYKLKIDDEIIESALDDYREWLHARSLCPNCKQTGIQSHKTLDYYCINCDAKWRANDARTCGLRRRKV